MPPPRRWTFGRAPECDVVLNQTGISWQHCTLTQTGSDFVLEDLQSSNGTFVNGVRITAPTPVRRTDTIILGTNVRFPWPKTETPAPKPASPVPTLLTPMASQTERLIRIGRAPDNDVVLDFPMVSFQHARIHIAGTQMLLEDLGSSNGTSIGVPGRKIQKAPLTKDDVVYFGTLRMPVSRLLAERTGMGQKPHQTVAIGKGAMLFGRDPNADHVLHDPLASWHHARLTRSAKGIVLEDLASSNGTYVNGRRIRGAVPVKLGDVIAMGTYTFTLNESNSLQERDLRGNLILEARGISVAVKGKRLLDDVSLTIYPSEFVGLMGPSGAGKTTLMNALNGYINPSAGDVLLNGQSLADHYRQFAAFLGYVPQEDIIHRDLTVRQALYYTARLRLPPDFSDADIAIRIKDVVKQLELEGTENTLIGSPEKRGISGGQRKRVNLAMELLTDPLVLFLDEPTSGLSSGDALKVMMVLRELANQGKSILLTIHQPSLEVFKLMDNLVLVAKDKNSREPGRLAYYGPAHPDAIDFFSPGKSANGGLPDDIFKALDQPKPSAHDWTEKYNASDYYQDYIADRTDESAANQVPVPVQRPTVSFFYQWRALTWRYLTIKIKDTFNTGILLAQPPIVAILIVLVFGKGVREKVTTVHSWGSVSNSLGLTLFMLALAAIWVGASNAIREIVGEWAIYVRERMVNLSIPAYIASKFTILGGLAVIQCTCLLAIVGLGCKLEQWLLLFGFLVTAAMIGVAVGLLLSAVARTSEMAISLLPIVLLGMVVLGGSMKPVHEMGEETQIICFLNPARWTFEGMLVAESANRERLKPLDQPILSKDPGEPPAFFVVEDASKDKEDTDPAVGKKDHRPRDMAHQFFPRKLTDEKRTVREPQISFCKPRFPIWVPMLALPALFVGCVNLILLILKFRDIRR